MTGSIKSEQKTSRQQLLALGLLLVIALAVRVWFGSSGLDMQRFFDERYTLENVENFLEGELEPVSGWYPSLAYLPHTALLYAVDKVAGFVSPSSWRLKRYGVLSPEAILASRILQATYGTASVWLVFLIGRRMFDPTIGFAAAFFLTFVPGHVQLSAIIKPDILMILFVLAVFLVSLRLSERLSLGPVLLAGALVGAAIAAKQYGVVAALPLTAAVLLERPGWRRSAYYLGSALVAALAVFVATNPWLRILIDYAVRNQRIYEGYSQGRLRVLADALTFPLSDSGHGAILGLVALAGVVALGAGAWRRLTPASGPKGRFLLLTTMVGYIALCVVFLTWSKYNLWVPLAPFTAIAAGFATVTTLRHLRRVAGLLPMAAMGLAFLALAMAPGFRTIYIARVPTTEQKAREVLRARWRDGRQRLVYRERSAPPLLAAWTWHKKFVVAEVDRLPELRGRRLDLADGEVFLASRLEGPEGEFYRQRMASHPEGLVEIESGWFRARGEDLVLVDHGWQRRGPAQDVVLEPTADGNAFAGRLPSPGPRRAIVSLELWLAEGAATKGVVNIGGKPIELLEVRLSPPYMLYMTPRIRIPAGREQQISVRLPAESDIERSGLSIGLHNWRPKPRGEANGRR